MENPETRQYDEISREFSKLIEADPSHRYAQLPTALRLLGEVKDKKILDIGCGDGTFDRQLAEQGANVIAYDISIEQIKRAKEKKEEIRGDDNSEVKYFVSDRMSFKKDVKFDSVVSNMALPYIDNEQKLEDLFKDVRNHLKNEGKFVSIVFNPEFKRFNKILYNRRWTKDDSGKIKVEFFNDKKELETSANYNNSFSRDDYERYAKQVGFSKIRWDDIEIEKEGIEKMGKDFWEGYKEDCPYVALVLEK